MFGILDSTKYSESGGNSGEDTPVPISNTEVKLSSADDTWWETARESRTLPVSLKSKLQMQLAFLVPQERMKRDSGGAGFVKKRVVRTARSFFICRLMI